MHTPRFGALSANGKAAVAVVVGLVVIVGLTYGLSLAGGRGEPTVVDTAATTTTAAASSAPRPVRPYVPPATATSRADERYMRTVEREAPAVMVGNSRADLVELAGITCDALRGGQTPTEVIRTMTESGFLLSQSMTILDAARSAYCPGAGTR